MTATPPERRCPQAGTDRLRSVLATLREVRDAPTAQALDLVVACACEALGAAYGALGVIAPDGSVEHFVEHAGPGDGAEDRLGIVVPVARAARIDDLHAGICARAGAPTRMRSFLGVPIRARGAAFGELYVADPEVGRFDADDEQLLLTLAAAAGSAIDTARLSEELQHSSSWLDAAGEISRTLLSGADDDALLAVVSRALSIGEADFAALVLPTRDGRLQVTLGRGLGEEDFGGFVFDPAESVLGRIIMRGASERTADVMQWARPGYDNQYGFGPAMVASLAGRTGSRGAVLMYRTRGRAPFGTRDVELASTFAAQVAVALEMSDARADAEWLHTLEDRHRIARELHDNVMQRLFAIGVGLQTLSGLPIGDGPVDRLHRHVSELDETIDEIRSRVFDLREDSRHQALRRRDTFPQLPGTGRTDCKDAGSAAPRPPTDRGVPTGEALT